MGAGPGGAGCNVQCAAARLRGGEGGEGRCIRASENFGQDFQSMKPERVHEKSFISNVHWRRRRGARQVVGWDEVCTLCGGSALSTQTSAMQVQVQCMPCV